MRTLVTDPVVADSITVTRAPAVQELLQLDAGDELRWDDRDADHRIFVMRGTCRVLGRQIHAGASAFVPAGMTHTLKAGAWGCTVLSVDTATATATVTV